MVVIKILFFSQTKFTYVQTKQRGILMDFGIQITRPPNNQQRIDGFFLGGKNSRLLGFLGLVGIRTSWDLGTSTPVFLGNKYQTNKKQQKIIVSKY